MKGKAVFPVERAVTNAQADKIVNRIIRRVLKCRRTSRKICKIIYNALKSEGVQVQHVARAKTPNTKFVWHGVGIGDWYIRQQLRKRLRHACYTSKTTVMRCKKLHLPTLHVLTYNQYNQY